jgi:hypothetical protein
MINFDDLESAFLFVGYGYQGENQAYINRETGEIYYQSTDLGDEELPDDIEDEQKYLIIPHTNDLNLGIDLVFSFTLREAPERYDEVRQIFRRKGAYGRFHNLLERINLLQKWYDFRDAATTEAIMEWCAENGLKVKK